MLFGMNLRKITAGMWSENIGMKAFEANGFSLEGTRKQYEANGKFYDSFEYGLLKDEWEERQNV